MGFKLVTGALLALSLTSTPLISSPALAAPAKVKTVVVNTEFRAAHSGPAVAYPATLGADIKAAVTARLAEKGLITKGSGAKLRLALKGVGLDTSRPGYIKLSAYVREGYMQQSSKSGVSYHSFWIAVAVPQSPVKALKHGQRAPGGAKYASDYEALVNAFADQVVARIGK